MKLALFWQKSKAGPVLLSALDDKLDADMKIVKLDGFEAVQDKIRTIAKKNPQWFPAGFAGINAVSNEDFYAAINPANGMVYISVADVLYPGFSPAKELIAAIQLPQNKDLTFKNEYAIETLWHEITHSITGISVINPEIGRDSIDEGIVQLVSRLTYPKFMTALELKPAHQEDIISRGLAYPKVTGNLLTLVQMANIEREQLVDVVLNNRDNWQEVLGEMLSIGLNIHAGRIRSLYGHAQGKSQQDFIAKIKVMARNAPRNIR